MALRFHSLTIQAAFPVTAGGAAFSVFGRGDAQGYESYAHLKPGQKGTVRLKEKYGDALLCMRYRFDEIRQVKIKTVELIVDEKPLHMPRFRDEDMVPVSVAFDEVELRQQLRRMRGR